MTDLRTLFDRPPYALAISYRGRDEGPPPDCRPERIAIRGAAGRRLAGGYGLDIPNVLSLIRWLDSLDRNVTIQAQRVRRSDDMAPAVWLVIGRAPRA